MFKLDSYEGGDEVATAEQKERLAQAMEAELEEVFGSLEKMDEHEKLEEHNTRLCINYLRTGKWEVTYFFYNEDFDFHSKFDTDSVVKYFTENIDNACKSYGVE